jgi:hypothetical protein
MLMRLVCYLGTCRFGGKDSVRQLATHEGDVNEVEGFYRDFCDFHSVSESHVGGKSSGRSAFEVEKVASFR